MIGNSSSRRDSGRWAVCAASCALILLLLLPSSAFAYDFAGTVKSVSDPNSLRVNVTEPGTIGLQADLDVLLDRPLYGLSRFIGKKLDFSILGHDILNRPVCEASLNGTSIRTISYCAENPVECSYYEHSPAYYGWYLLPVWRVYNPCIYGLCRQDYPYQWLSFP